jgi:23S rRNA (adenine2503-C2)-methyltransferase
VKIVGQRGESDLATVYIGELSGGELIEFVESVQPPIPQSEKWVLIVSTLKGCPVNCPICDAGTSYAGKLSFGEIIGQIDYMVRKRYSDGKIPVSKFKIQFARMGDPVFNPAVLNRLYSEGRFQMQFSIHTSSEDARPELVPCSTLSFAEMSKWGGEFFSPGDRKISLNFAAVRGYPVDPAVISDHFSPECFMIKLTPVNPTHSSVSSGLVGVIDPDFPETADELVDGFQNEGFDTILSIGETRENRIGSNCGMYVGRLSSNPGEIAPQIPAVRMLPHAHPDRHCRE